MPARLELIAAFSVSCFLAFTVVALLAEGYRVKGEMFSGTDTPRRQDAVPVRRH